MSQSIDAYQLIFANVEAEQSPTRRRGYQTLFYTRQGLSAADAREIEERLFYVPKKGQPVKHIFFNTSSAKAVVAQIVPLGGTDQFGRSGRYFAHALIFSDDAFDGLKNNPFTLFRQFAFMTTVERALEVGDFATGDIRPAEVTVPGRRRERELDITVRPESLTTMLLLAAQAKRLAKESRAVGCFGEAEQMFQLLRALFEIIPPSLRRYCSFDTLFSEGTLSRLSYWAVGLPAEEPRKPNLITFDLAELRFAHAVDCAPQSAFERWLAHIVRREPLTTVAECSPSAYVLGQWFDGGSPDRSALKKVGDTVFKTFVELNPGPFGQRIQEVLTRQVGAPAWGRIQAQAVAWAEQQGPAALPHWERGFDKVQIARWLDAAYPDTRCPASPMELQALQQCAEALGSSSEAQRVQRRVRYWRHQTGEERSREREALADPVAGRRRVKIKSVLPITILALTATMIMLAVYYWLDRSTPGGFGRTELGKYLNALAGIITPSPGKSDLEKAVYAALGQKSLIAPKNASAYDLYHKLKEKEPRSRELGPITAAVLSRINQHEEAVFGRWREQPRLDTEVPWADSLKLFEWGVELKPGHAKMQARLYYCKGRVALNQEDFSAAIKSWREAIKIDKEWSLVYHEMGRAYMARQDFKNARAFFLKAIEYEPDWIFPYRNLATVCLTPRQFSEAERPYRGAVAAAPDKYKAELWYKLGQYYEQQRLYPQAMAEYKKALEIVQTNSNPGLSVEDLRDRIRTVRQQSGVLSRRGLRQS